MTPKRFKQIESITPEERADFLILQERNNRIRQKLEELKKKGEFPAALTAAKRASATLLRHGPRHSTESLCQLRFEKLAQMTGLPPEELEFFQDTLSEEEGKKLFGNNCREEAVK